MARNLAEKRLAGWIAFCSNSQCREGLRRDAGPEFGRENIERAAAAFSLDAQADRDLLLGILADIASPTLRLDGPWCVGWARVSEEYRLPSKPLLEIWISGRMGQCAHALFDLLYKYRGRRARYL
jgi:hypothetical protein